MKRNFRHVAVLFFVASLGPNAGAQDEPRKVVVEMPTARQATRYLQSTGTLQAVNSVDLVARVSGTLEKVNFADGAEVVKNDVIFVIEPEPYHIALASAQAVLAAAEANRVKAEATLRSFASTTTIQPTASEPKAT